MDLESKEDSDRIQNEECNVALRSNVLSKIKRGFIYIEYKVTDCAISNNFFRESFATKEFLFYYLKHTSLMQFSDAYLRKYKLTDTNASILVFNTRLHHNENGEVIYAVADYMASGEYEGIIQSIDQFMTADQISTRYHINQNKLPLASGELCDVRNINHYAQRLNLDSLLGMNQIPPNKSKKSKKKHKNRYTAKIEAEISSIELYKIINAALHNQDKQHPMIPVISFEFEEMNVGSDQKNTDIVRYFIDRILPIQVLPGQWIGILFRGYTPISFCIDYHDIWNKIQLYNPNRDRSNYGKNINFHNDLFKLSIIPDHGSISRPREIELMQEINKQDYKIQRLTDIVSALKAKMYDCMDCKSYCMKVMDTVLNGGVFEDNNCIHCKVQYI